MDSDQEPPPSRGLPSQPAPRPLTTHRTDTTKPGDLTSVEGVQEVPSPAESTDMAGSGVSSPTPTQPELSFAAPLGGNFGSPSLSSWSSSSDHQLGHGAHDNDPSDRVFPIRSVLSVDTRSGRASGDQQEHFARPRSETSPLSPRRTSNPSVDLSGMSSRRVGSGSATTETPVSSSSAATHTAPTDRVSRRRKNTMSGSTSSIQADAERHRSSGFGALPIFSDESSEGEGSDAAASLSQPPLMAVSQGSESGMSTTGSLSEGFVTVRYQHQLAEDGHAVITGREETLQRCEDEPIHAPGAVQGFGLLIAISEDSNGKLIVRYASKNSKRIIGYSPQQLFKLDNFLDILTDEQADNLLDHIDFIRDEDADPAVNGPEVFSVSVRPPRPRAKAMKLWCAIHINPTCPDLVICEFELDDDQVNPLRPPGELTPDSPQDTLQANPTSEELTESTEILSRPLRVLRSARKRRGEAGAMQVFDIMSQVQEQLASAPNLERFLKILVGIVKELTGFHRIMIYQFDASFNGKVVTELVDPARTRDLYKGLHFPASDIPKQARALYKINKVRLLYDRDQPTARLVCRTVGDLEKTLDLTHSYLRAISPIHLKYLGNMAVRSSMSISINAFGELWGLIACHSYGNRGMRVSFPIRKMCRLVGDTASRNIERLSYASRLQARKLINTVPTDKNPSGYIIASSDDLLQLFDADFGMLSIRGETKILGKIDHSQEALVMLEYLRVKKFTSVMTTQDFSVDLPDLRYQPGFSVIAGCLYVPLSVGGNDFIVFFRKGQAREVKWAGNPYEKIVREGTRGYLEPRQSFKVWHETVLGKCREWSEEQIETAAVLCLVYGKFIEVWRQKEAALQSSHLTRLLLANSAHEVRTPLNAIINYLEIAMEGTLDQETRDNLSKSHSASKSLIYVINDLLDLTKAEEGQELVKDEIFDFPACIREATEPFVSDAKRKGIGYEVVEHPGLPRAVYGDHRKVRQAVANITANAVQHTVEGWVKIELCIAEVLDHKVRVEIVVQDTGRGMDNSQLDAIFRDLEQVSTDLDDPEQPPAEKGVVGPDDAPPRTLGLGLAVVARIVRNMDGQLRLKSEPGKGSRFVIQLPFDLPVDNSPGSQGGSVVVHSSAVSTAASASGAIRLEGEVTLVDGGLSGPSMGLSQKKSFDSQSIASQRSATSKGSGRSGRSSRSDADRLIDAIQLPLALGEPGPKQKGLQRQNSKGPYYNPTQSNLGSPSAESPPPHRHSGSFPAPSPNPGPVAIAPRIPAAQISSSEPIITTESSFPSTDRPPATGVQYVTDTKTPLKPVKIPDDNEYRGKPELPQQSPTSGVLFEITEGPTRIKGKEVAKEPAKKPTSEARTPADATRKQLSVKLQVLCAEDDPTNMKLLRKRLEKAGHDVFHTVNGEECASVYKEAPKSFDVVLMDMQMPLVDGLTSTKMIRAFEGSKDHVGLSEAATKNGRIPIFAVSASLLESNKNEYVRAGFDGWILKPIDFKRLETLLLGINEDGVRRECLYQAGRWERGGWFEKDVGPASEARDGGAAAAGSLGG